MSGILKTLYIWLKSYLRQIEMPYITYRKALGIGRQMEHAWDMTLSRGIVPNEEAFGHWYAYQKEKHCY